MSTGFRSAATGEWACVRYAGAARRADGYGYSVDFGAGGPERAMAVMRAAQEGAAFDAEDGFYSGEQFMEMVRGAVGFTFGVFGGTMEVGSGDMMTFAGY